MTNKFKINRALLSCWDKSGLVEFATVLAENGVEIISSGGTASHLEEQKIPVTRVEEITGFPEILDGRVKTLHPYIHGAILARRTEIHLSELKTQHIRPIELVVVNLYPFLEAVKNRERSLAEMIEYIDIGGPAMLRAAAKNFAHVAALHTPAQYGLFLKIWRENGLSIPEEQRRRWASDVFFYTAHYDAEITRYLDEPQGKTVLPKRFGQFFTKAQDLRYGENPHQAAAIYDRFTGEAAAPEPKFRQLWGKEMSFNNYVDVSAAWDAVSEFEAEPAVAIIKHTNPCGCAVSAKLPEAFLRALAGDPLSAYGGIVALNKKVEQETASLISESFYECIIAPAYSQEALQILKKKKNLRILEVPAESVAQNSADYKFLAAGLLVQEKDLLHYDPDKLQSVGGRKASADETADLLFAWKVVKHVKSNAIIFVKNKQLLGAGAGQMSRVDAVKLARQKAQDAGHDLKGAVMASDAFFPFRDGVDEAARAGITAVIQPGGSIRDKEVIAAIAEHNMAMLLTGIRHFKH